MNKNWARLLCLVLAVLMTLTVFGACKKEETKKEPSKAASTTDVTNDVVDEPAVEVVDDTQYYEVSDPELVTVFVDNEAGTTTMNVIEGTTVEQFAAAVVAKEGFTYKLFDAEGKEITEGALVEGGKFEVYKDGEESAVVSYPITLVTQAEQEELLDEASQAEVQAQGGTSTVVVKKENSKTTSKNNNKNNTTSKTTGGNKNNLAGSAAGGRSQVSQADITGGGKADNLKDYKFQFNTAYYAGRVGSGAEAKIYSSKIKAIDKKLGCKTVVTNDAGDATAIANAILAGKKYADIIEVSLPAARNLARAGATCNLFESKTLNKNLYKTGLTESVTFKGKAYGVAFAAMSSNSMGVTFNKDLIKKWAPTYDIYSLYKSRKWTTEAYADIMQACTQDTDGNGRIDVYGMVSNTNVIGMAITSYAGGTATKNKSNGYIDIVMCNQYGIQSLYWCKEAKNNKSYQYYPDINTAISTFANGNAATFASYMHYINNISATAKFDFGFVPFPIAPNTPFKNYITACYDGRAFVVPVTNKKNLDNCGKWLNEIAGISDQLVTMSARGYQNCGLDANGVAVYRWSVNNTSAEYSTGPFSGNTSSKIDTAVTSRAKDPSKVCQEVIVSGQMELNDYYGKLTGQPSSYRYNP